MTPTLGLHHVTAIAIDPQANLDFYTRVLGLRLVKNTVNFDAPDIYHFYYGNDQGEPGTILTFFPFVDASRGRAGSGMADTISFAVPADSLDGWRERLAQHKIAMSPTFSRFGAAVIAFTDTDGLKLELVASGPAGSPAVAQPLGFDAVSLAVTHPERTAKVLTDLLGLHPTGEDAGRVRYTASSGALARHIDIVPMGAGRGDPGGGTTHHVAFRAPDDTALAAYRAHATALGLAVTPVIDRQYFHSIYFREPGGVLFEIATDPPGFTTDEALDALGSSLQLPPKYEAQRAEIERRLPAIELPVPGRG